VRDILGYQLPFKNVIGGRSCPSVLSLLALLVACGFAMAVDDNVPLMTCKLVHPSCTAKLLFPLTLLLCNSKTMIPHPTIPVLAIRPVDIWLLLAAGALLELISRALIYIFKRPSSRELECKEDLFILQFETAKMRRLGPQAFVETSKLERKLLQVEKRLSEQQQARLDSTAYMQKIVKNVSLSLYLIVFIIYYGIPLVALDGNKVDSDNLESTSESRARSFLNGLLFPISYIGVGVKIAKIGLQQVGIGALVVLWSSQVTIGKVMDCFEALVL
jgi:hypothetical protein